MAGLSRPIRAHSEASIKPVHRRIKRMLIELDSDLMLAVRMPERLISGC